MAADDPSTKLLAGLTVLVVEDSWHLADALGTLIESAGGTVVGLASTLGEAEEMAAQHGFDAAVIDLNLHDESAKLLAARLADRGVKIVVLSANDVDPALASKVHVALVKPAAQSRVLAALGSAHRK